MKGRKTELLFRMYLVVFGFILAAMMLSYKTFKINVLEGDKWRERGDSLYLSYKPVQADRGNILADDGSLLATSMPIFEIRMDMKTPALTDAVFEKNIDSLAICLSKYVNPDKSPASFKSYLRRNRKSGNRYVLIARKINYPLLEKMKTFPLFTLGQFKGGFIVVRKNIREKPFKRLASRTLGEDRENAEMVGLEGAYDLFLKGSDGQRLEQRVPPGIWIPVNDFSKIEPEHGSDINSTINIQVQDIVDRALSEAMLRHEASWGTAIIMEVKTGAVKAISNLGKTNNGYWENYNYAVGTATEPGSTFKLATMLALLEDGFIDLHDTVDINQGQWSLFGQTIKDSHWDGVELISAREAFEISSNVGMARLVMSHYSKGKKAGLFVERLKKFGLSYKTGIAITGEASPLIREAYDYKNGWSKLSLPWMAHGYEVSLTPLQLLSFYNAVANDGKYMKPYLVHSIEDAGHTVKKFDPEVVRTIASESSILSVQELLRGVAIRGTAKKLKCNNTLFAGKTGTAVFGYNNKNERRKYQASFVGYFPAEDPTYSCIVVIRDPIKHGYYGSDVAGPVFANIADHIMSKSGYTNIENMDTMTLTSTQMPYYDLGYGSEISALFDFASLTYNIDEGVEWAVTVPDNGSIKIKSKYLDGDELVPDVRGMGLRDALYLLESRGLKVEVLGFGKIKYQSLEPGLKIKGQEIKLTLS